MEYRYWKPGGENGGIEAGSSYEAATKVLETDDIYFVHGDRYAASGQLFVSGDGEHTCKIWHPDHTC